MLEFMRLRLGIARADLERGHRREQELLESIEDLRHRVRQQRPMDKQLQLLEERIIELNDSIVEYDCETRVMIKLTRNTIWKMDQIMRRAAAVSVASSVTEEVDMETASMVTRVDEFSMATRGDASSVATKPSLERQPSARSDRSMSTTGGSINSNESGSSQIRLGPAAA